MLAGQEMFSMKSGASGEAPSAYAVRLSSFARYAKYHKLFL